MKIRTLIVCILGVWVVSNVSMAQDVETLEPVSSFETPAEPKPVPLYRGRPIQNATSTARTSTSSPKVVKIYQLKYADTEELARLIGNLFRIDVNIDYRLNRLIVNATGEQLKSIENLIIATDIADPQASRSRDIQNLVYRIYMFETLSVIENMKPFSMSLESTVQVSPQQLLDAAAEKEVQISEFRQIDKGSSSDILLQGKAASYESLRRMVDKLPESNIDELKWDDDDAETFTDKIAAAQYTQLPEQMQNYIRKFLGDEIRTVGYWFGNLSNPGEVEAPIGPWTMKLELDTEPDRMLKLNVDVEVPDEMNSFNERLGRERNNEILSNTIRTKIGKPIIIGYNRESYSTRKMGAMVIVPEADMIQLQEHKNNY